MAQDRRGFIGGSDAVRIVQGHWHQLWLEKTGRAEPEDLSAEFAVQLGIYTESFHLRWLSQHMGYLCAAPILQEGETHFRHKEYPWMRAMLDAWLPLKDTFIECKHSHGANTAHDAALYYLPQIAHYCNVTGTDHGYLSVICGNRAPEVIKVEPSDEYRANLIELEKQFWWAVENDIEPSVEQDAAAVKASAKREAKLDGMRAVDMTGNNHWSDLAFAYIETKDARDSHEQAKEELKKLVPKDAYEVSGAGLVIKRSKSNALLISRAA